MLIYFLYVVDKFNAKFDSINKLQTDIRVLEKKHNRLERRLKASLLRVNLFVCIFYLVCLKNMSGSFTFTSPRTPFQQQH